MPATRPRRRAAADIAAITRHHGPDDPRLPELRRELRELQLAEHIRAVVDEAPPLTPEQLDRLAGLLRGSA
jgi:hypothetical protein